jgi:tRNA(Ile)-lysidine synthase
LILQENAQTNNSSAFHLQVEELPTGTVPAAKDFLNKAQAFVDADSIKGKLTLRPMRQGDRFRPYGMKQGSKLLSDFLTDRKVSFLDKQAQLVATDTATNAIIWVVGREIDHRYRITPTTKRILRLFCVDG